MSDVEHIGVGGAFLLLWFLRHTGLNSFAAAKACCYLVFVTGFFGAALWPVDVGWFTLFPHRALLLLLWVLFALQAFMSGGKIRFRMGRVRVWLAFLGSWLAYAAVSLAWAASVEAAVRQLVLLFMGISTIFFFTRYFQDERDFATLHSLWLWISVGLILLGLWENLTGQHLHVSRLLRETRPDLAFMPTGVFGNPNDYATYLALSIPFAFGVTAHAQQVSLRFLALLVALTAFYLIVAAGSRANILAVFVEIAFLMIFLLDLKQRTMILALVAVVTIGLLSLQPGMLRSLLDGIGFQLSSLVKRQHLEMDSAGVRINLTKNGLAFVYSTAGFGVGAGNAEYWMSKFAEYDTGGIVNLHNWWLEVLVNYGILVFAAYVWLFSSVVRGLWRANRMAITKQHKMLSQALLVALVGFPLASISSSSIMAMAPHWFLFAFAMAFLNSIQGRGGHERSRDISHVSINR